MRKILIVVLLLFAVNVKSQEAEKPSVDKNMLGVQLGLLSGGFQYETRLARKTALRIEAGVFGFFYTRHGLVDESGFIVTPFLSVEPRWYYGLDRRARLQKNTAHNGSNFVSLKAGYFANDIEVTNSDGSYNVVPAAVLVPYYGIRRTFAKHFNYEFAFGVGYQYNIFGDEGCNCDHSETMVDIQARIGYTF